MDKSEYERLQKMLTLISLRKNFPSSFPDGWTELVSSWEFKMDQYEQSCDDFEKKHPEYDFCNYKAELSAEIERQFSLIQSPDELDLDDLDAFRIN